MTHNGSVMRTALSLCGIGHSHNAGNSYNGHSSFNCQIRVTSASLPSEQRGLLTNLVVELGQGRCGNSVEACCCYGIVAGLSSPVHTEQMDITMSEVIYA